MGTNGILITSTFSSSYMAVQSTLGLGLVENETLFLPIHSNSFPVLITNVLHTVDTVVLFFFQGLPRDFLQKAVMWIPGSSQP